jgi:hypothetical protein
MRDVAPDSEQAIGILRADHGHIKELLSRLEKADKTEQDRVLADLFLDLRIHSVLEQQVFYPSLSRLVDAKQLAESGKDFYFMLALMLELENIYASSEPLESTLTLLAERFEQHVKKDESLFKQADKWASAQLSNIAVKMESYRIELKEKLSRNFSSQREAKDNRHLRSVMVRHTRCA